MNSLPWIPKSVYPYIHPQDPLEERDALPDPSHLQAIIRGEVPRTPGVMGQELGGASVRTALTVEPREGVLCVFMPPVSTIEDYLELLTRR